MVIEGLSLIFIPRWRWISLLIPLAPLPTSPLFLLIWSSICLPLSCCALPSSPVLEQRGTYLREGGRDANPSRSPSGIQVSAERTSPFEGQRNISSPAISRKTDGGTKGGGLGLSGEGSGGGEKPLLPTVVWEEVVLVLVLCLTAAREVFAASGSRSPKPIPR